MYIKSNSDPEDRQIRRVTSVTITGNVVLSALKLAAGLFGHSGAMISDAVHSLSDVATTIVAYVGVRLSRHKPDEEHQYGHERIESLATLILGLLLAITGVGIGYKGIINIAEGTALPVPGAIALIAAAVSIAVKEAMYWYTRHYARLLHSEAFMADAWHHRSDAFSSIGSLVGIAGARLGYPIMDSLASVVICVFILRVSVSMMKDALSQMLDTSRGPEYEAEMAAFVRNQPGVISVDMLHTRRFGNKTYVDLEISADGDMSLREAHDIAERVHDGIEGTYDNIKHVMVHVNPA